jgi:hypothetical protein
MSEIENRLERIEEDQKVVLETVTELKMAVIGSEKLGVKGLIKKVDEHEKYIESDKKMKWTVAGGVTVISSVVASLWNKLF